MFVKIRQFNSVSNRVPARILNVKFSEVEKYNRHFGDAFIKLLLNVTMYLMQNMPFGFFILTSLSLCVLSTICDSIGSPVEP